MYKLSQALNGGVELSPSVFGIWNFSYYFGQFDRELAEVIHCRCLCDSPGRVGQTSPCVVVFQSETLSAFPPLIFSLHVFCFLVLLFPLVAREAEAAARYANHGGKCLSRWLMEAPHLTSKL